MFNRFPKRGKQKKKTIMKKNANEIFMLQYRIKRYQAPLNKMNGGGKFSFPALFFYKPPAYTG